MKWSNATFDSQKLPAVVYLKQSQYRVDNNNCTGTSDENHCAPNTLENIFLMFEIFMFTKKLVCCSNLYLKKHEKCWLSARNVNCFYICFPECFLITYPSVSLLWSLPWCRFCIVSGCRWCWSVAGNFWLSNSARAILLVFAYLRLAWLTISSWCTLLLYSQRKS